MDKNIVYLTFGVCFTMKSIFIMLDVVSQGSGKHLESPLKQFLITPINTYTFLNIGVTITINVIMSSTNNKFGSMKTTAIMKMMKYLNNTHVQGHIICWLKWSTGKVCQGTSIMMCTKCSFTIPQHPVVCSTNFMTQINQSPAVYPLQYLFVGDTDATKCS